MGGREGAPRRRRADLLLPAHRDQGEGRSDAGAEGDGREMVGRTTALHPRRKVRAPSGVAFRRAAFDVRLTLIGLGPYPEVTLAEARAGAASRLSPRPPNELLNSTAMAGRPRARSLNRNARTAAAEWRGRPRIRSSRRGPESPGAGRSRLGTR